MELWTPSEFETNSKHASMVSLTAWFVRHFPYAFDFVIDHHSKLATSSVEALLLDVHRMEFGVKCGGLATMMARVAKLHGYDAYELNFGVVGGGTHVVVLVDIGDDELVIYDPTLGCYSGLEDGSPASIQSVITSIGMEVDTRFRWVLIGERRRRILFSHDVAPPIPPVSSTEQVDPRRLTAFIDLDEFADISWQLIQQSVPLNGRGSRFDCLCWPIGTSGEARIEAIAEQLRARAPAAIAGPNGQAGFFR